MPVCVIELIDTLWNVNLSLYFPLQLLLRELIDTLWNVNSVFKRSHSSVVPELIDTLWNVNFFEIITYFISIMN